MCILVSEAAYMSSAGPVTTSPASHRAEATNRNAVLDAAVQRLVTALNPDRIYLFGSQARGEATADSDYDFLVVVRDRRGDGRADERRAFDALWDWGSPKT